MDSNSFSWVALVLPLVLGCGGVQPASQNSWPKTSLGQVSASADSFIQPAIAVDADGKPAVAYVDQGILIVKKWNGSGWSQLGGAISAGGASAKLPALTLDSGALAVAWEESTSSTYVVRASRFDGSSWRPLGTQLNAANTPAHQPRIASGKQGLVATYYGGNPSTAAFVTRWNGSAWQDWPATPSQNALTVELALLPDGSPAVTWLRSFWQSTGVQWEVATRYWSVSAGAWASLPSVNFQYSAAISLAADIDGSLFLAADSAGSLSPMPVRRAGMGATDWQPVGKPDGAFNLGGPLILLPGSGIALAFSAFPGGEVARYTGSGWEILATVDTDPFSFAGAADGTLYAAWLNSGQFSSSPIQAGSFRKP